VSPTPTATPIIACTGDCDQNATVEVDELVLLTALAFDPRRLDTCPAADPTGDRRVTIEEAVRAVKNARDGCLPIVCGGIDSRRCPHAALCEVPEGTCQVAEQTGVCIPLPRACPDLVAPVCGCDGVTYANDCRRRAAGIPPAHAGEC
jgi:hypothetical protein